MYGWYSCRKWNSETWYKVNFKNFKTFYSNLERIYLQNFQRCQIDIRLILSLILTRSTSLSETFKLDSITEACLFKLVNNFLITEVAAIDQISGKHLKDGAQILAKPKYKWVV